MLTLCVNSLRGHQAVIQSGCTVVWPEQQCLRTPAPPQLPALDVICLYDYPVFCLDFIWVLYKSLEMSPFFSFPYFPLCTLKYWIVMCILYSKNAYAVHVQLGKFLHIFTVECPTPRSRSRTCPSPQKAPLSIFLASHTPAKESFFWHLIID